MLRAFSELVSAIWRRSPESATCGLGSSSYSGFAFAGAFPRWIVPIADANLLQTSPARIVRQDEPEGHFLCSRGRIDRAIASTGDWDFLYAKALGQVTNALNLIGHVLTAPTFSSLPCFARNHDHGPSYGNAVSTGWKDFYRASFQYSQRTIHDFVCGMEGASLFFTDTVNLIADWSLSADDPGSVCGEPCLGRGTSSPEPVPEYYVCDFLAPNKLESIPLSGFVCENVKKLDIFGGTNGRLIFSRRGQPFFTASSPRNVPRVEDYGPAVEASIRAWRLGTMVLSRQDLVYLADIDEKALLVDGVYERALLGYLEYGRHLAALFRVAFEMGSGPQRHAGNLGEFHAGSMERPPLVSATQVPDLLAPSYTLPVGAFPWLRQAVAQYRALHPHLNFGPLDTIDFSKTNHTWVALSRFGDLCGDPAEAWRREILPVPPNYSISWLPHGMFRSALRDDVVALVVSNPWTGRYKPRSQPSTTISINPFHFEYDRAASPGSRSTAEYSFTFDFHPEAYFGAQGFYYRTVHFAADCRHVVTGPQQRVREGTASVRMSYPRLRPGESLAFVFQKD